MRNCYRLIIWLFLGLLFFGASNSLAWAKERAGADDLDAIYSERQTNLKTKSVFHSLLYLRHFLSLPFHGYLIGIEGKDSPFVSHIGKFRPPKNEYPGWSTCFLVNAYFSGASDCDEFDDSWLKKNAKAIAFNPVQVLLPEIKKTIDSLKEQDQSITHIIVFSTGYNTTQSESLANYHDLYLNLKNATQQDLWKAFTRHDWWKAIPHEFWKMIKCALPTFIVDSCRFNPLFIGISWQSFSPIRFIDSKAWGGDFKPATERAEKIGKELSKSLIEGVLFPLKTENPDLRIILIGHSLGAKILSQAAYSVNTNEIDQKIDLLIGLQGAFDLRRHVPDQNLYAYKHGDDKVKVTIYTSSKNDKILNFLKKKNYLFSRNYLPIGLAEARKIAREKYPDVFSFADVDENGEISDISSCGNKKPIIMNADSLIERNPFKSFSGAHSDIYRKEVGVFLWRVIEECGYK